MKPIKINYLQVKRKEKKQKDVKKGEEREELDFKFDEEVNQSSSCQNNAYVEGSVKCSNSIENITNINRKFDYLY